MLNLLQYLIKQGVATAKEICQPLAPGVRGLPRLTEQACRSDCTSCRQACPTDAIKIANNGSGQSISLDLGNCIACGVCLDVCPTGTLANDSTTKTARTSRDALIISAADATASVAAQEAGIFKRSIAVRVVSTGCSACDLEIGAAGNPIFDMERFGVHVVASPRFADVLMVTGPVPKAMHDPLKRCYEAMAEPRLVIAAGTCAISGGVHKGGYTQANGVDSIIPVDVYIPGCPPHPWSIIYGVMLAMHGGKTPRPSVG